MIREIVSQKCGDYGGFLLISVLNYTMVIDISCPWITPAAQVPCYTSVLPWIPPRGERMLNSGRRSPIARQVHKACTFGGTLFKKRIVIPMGFLSPRWYEDINNLSNINDWLVVWIRNGLFSISLKWDVIRNPLTNSMIFQRGWNQPVGSTRSCGSHDTVSACCNGTVEFIKYNIVTINTTYFIEYYDYYAKKWVWIVWIQNFIGPETPHAGPNGPVFWHTMTY